MMRSADSRTFRWTVYLTAAEFRLLELMRNQLGEGWGPLSRAQLLMLFAEQGLHEDLGPSVLEAWRQVEKEMRWTEDHSYQGGRGARINLNPGRRSNA